MSKETIKATINTNIRQNGQGLIDGVKMNRVLNDMVDDSYAEIGDLALELTEIKSEIYEGGEEVISFELGTIIAGYPSPNSKYARTPLIPISETTHYSFVHTSSASPTSTNHAYYLYKDGTYTGVTAAYNTQDGITITKDDSFNGIRFRLSYGVDITEEIASATKVKYGKPVSRLDGIEQEIAETKDELATTIEEQIEPINKVLNITNQGTQTIELRKASVTWESGSWEMGDYQVGQVYVESINRDRTSAITKVEIKQGDVITINYLRGFSDNRRAYGIVNTSMVIKDLARATTTPFEGVVLNIDEDGYMYIESAGSSYQTNFSITIKRTAPESARLNKIETDINRLEGEISSVVSDATNISAYYESKGFERKSVANNADFKFLFFSDLHKAETNLSRILELANSWGTTAIDAIINGGDSVLSNITEDLSWYDSRVNASSFDVLNCVGNHDAWQTNFVLADTTTIYNKIIAPMKARVQGITQPSGALYYYKDYGNVRVIVINAMSGDLLMWDSTQATWLENTLADAKANNLSVMVVTHYPFYKNSIASVDCNWSSYKFPSDNQYTNAEAVAKVKAFKDNGGKFICWLCGHTHFDQVLTCEGQVMLDITSARYNFKEDGVLATTTAQKQYDAFNYIGIDTTNHFIKVMRIGWDMDRTMKQRHFFCYDYLNNKVISD